IRFILRESEFRSMHSNDRQTFVAIAFVPRLHIRQRPNAIDAGVVPEIHKHCPPAKLTEAQRRRIQPDAADLRSTNFAFLDSHRPDDSSLWPTSLAQYCTRS